MASSAQNAQILGLVPNNLIAGQQRQTKRFSSRSDHPENRRIPACVEAAERDSPRVRVRRRIWTRASRQNIGLIVDRQFTLACWNNLCSYLLFR